MIFDNAQALFALALLPLFFIAGLLHFRRHRSVLNYFSPSLPEERRSRFIKKITLKFFFSQFFFQIFLGCAVIALAGPRWGIRLDTEFRRGLDIVLAMDLSRSMEVRDTSPGGGGLSRMEKAAEIAAGLVAGEAAGRAGGERFALALGKGLGVLALPLTSDTEAALSLLEGLSGSLITGRGTNLEQLIDAATAAFQDAFPTRRLLVLFSDGESLEGSVSAAVSRAVEKGILIAAVGLGSETGGRVPGDTLNTGIFSFQRSAVLKEAAERSGGVYIDGNESGASRLLGEYLASLGSPSLTRASRRELSPRWYVFVIAALGALALSRICEKDFKLRGLLLAALLGLSSCSQIRPKVVVLEGNFFYSRGMYNNAITSFLEARNFPEAAPYGEYGLALVYASLDEKTAAAGLLDAAEEALEKLDREDHRELIYRIRYNRAMIRYEETDYAAAADEFRRALEVDGSRIEAKRNLELSLLSLESRPSSAPSSISMDAAGGGGGSTILFDYIRRKEQEQWKSREWIEDTGFSGPDY